MPSQLDLDQGGTQRQWVLTYMGPSVGWVYLPGRNPLVITAPGTYSLQPSTSVANINTNAGPVTVILPSCIEPSVPAGVQPPLFGRTTMSIVDVGGFAATNPITIRPISVAETIMGLTQIQITSNYGAFVLSPYSALSKWVNNIQ